MAAPTGAALLLPAETRGFHLIRLASLSTFPSRGRLERENKSPHMNVRAFDIFSAGQEYNYIMYFFSSAGTVSGSTEMLMTKSIFSAAANLSSQAMKVQRASLDLSPTSL